MLIRMFLQLSSAFNLISAPSIPLSEGETKCCPPVIRMQIHLRVLRISAASFSLPSAETFRGSRKPEKDKLQGFNGWIQLKARLAAADGTQTFLFSCCRDDRGGQRSWGTEETLMESYGRRSGGQKVLQLLQHQVRFLPSVQIVKLHTRRLLILYSWWRHKYE